LIDPSPIYHETLHTSYSHFFLIHTLKERLSPSGSNQMSQIYRTLIPSGYEVHGPMGERGDR
jgi:hypothetical protein